MGRWLNGGEDRQKREVMRVGRKVDQARTVGSMAVAQATTYQIPLLLSPSLEERSSVKQAGWIVWSSKKVALWSWQADKLLLLSLPVPHPPQLLPSASAIPCIGITTPLFPSHTKVTFPVGQRMLVWWESH